MVLVSISREIWAWSFLHIKWCPDIDICSFFFFTDRPTAQKPLVKNLSFKQSTDCRLIKQLYVLTFKRFSNQKLCKSLHVR